MHNILWGLMRISALKEILKTVWKIVESQKPPWKIFQKLELTLSVYVNISKNTVSPNKHGSSVTILDLSTSVWLAGTQPLNTYIMGGGRQVYHHWIPIPIPYRFVFEIYNIKI